MNVNNYFYDAYNPTVSNSTIDNITINGIIIKEYGENIQQIIISPKNIKIYS